jgi:ABC-type sugar transport system permease subunit
LTWEVISASTVKKSEGFLANKRRLAIVVVAVLVPSFLLLLFASCLIKRKRKGKQIFRLIFLLILFLIFIYEKL